MTDPEDPNVRRKRYDALLATELGKLFIAHEDALVAYWQADAAQDEQIMALDKRARETTHVFVTKLMELAGV